MWILGRRDKCRSRHRPSDVGIDPKRMDRHRNRLFVQVDRQRWGILYGGRSACQRSGGACQQVSSMSPDQGALIKPVAIRYFMTSQETLLEAINIALWRSSSVG